MLAVSTTTMRPEVDSHQSHFLEACFLCQKPLGHNSDIFMYRGNTPFCSQECREEQIEIDEAKERRWKRSLRKTTTTTTTTNSESNSKKQPSSASSTTKAVRTSTVAVA